MLKRTFQCQPNLSSHRDMREFSTKNKKKAVLWPVKARIWSLGLLEQEDKKSGTLTTKQKILGRLFSSNDDI